MEKLIEFKNFADEIDWNVDESSELPSVDEIIDDWEALCVLKEDAFSILVDGFRHRKSAIRIKSVMLLAELFGNEDTFQLFYDALLDRKERAQFRFHIARHMKDYSGDKLQPLIQELEASKGCNDRILAAILMGECSDFSFRLLKLLQDTNDVVKIAAFLSLMRQPLGCLINPLQQFIQEASSRQLKLLEKNICYCEECYHYVLVNELLCRKLQSLKSRKVIFHPEYFEQSYSQEKLSKLDRHPVTLMEEEEEHTCIFDI